MRDIVDDEQRRRRAVTRCLEIGRPSGWGGFGPAAALCRWPLLNDDTASPASRRLAAYPKALPTRPAGLLPRVAKPDTMRRVAAAGADLAVVGSVICGVGEPEQTIVARFGKPSKGAE